MWFKNPRVCLPKNPICAAKYERKHAETNPESPKPNRIPAQLRFSITNAFLHIATFAFELPDPLIPLNQFLFQSSSFSVSAERQFKFLAYLEIALYNSRILFFNFLFRNLQCRRNNVETVPRSYRPWALGGC